MSYLSIAEEAKLEMKFVGYGKTYQEIYISFKNVGDITISDITLYIDGKAHKTIEGASSPGAIFEEVLFLEEGKHLIEARTPEGAYSSLEVTASKGEAKPTTTTSPEEPGEKIPFTHMTLIVILVVVLVIVVIVWFLRKKEELRREERS